MSSWHRSTQTKPRILLGRNALNKPRPLQPSRNHSEPAQSPSKHRRPREKRDRHARNYLPWNCLVRRHRQRARRHRLVRNRNSPPCPAAAHRMFLSHWSAINFSHPWMPLRNPPKQVLQSLRKIFSACQHQKRHQTSSLAPKLPLQCHRSQPRKNKHLKSLRLSNQAIA